MHKKITKAGKGFPCRKEKKFLRKIKYIQRVNFTSNSFGQNNYMFLKQIVHLSKIIIHILINEELIILEKDVRMLKNDSSQKL